jgi:replication factor A1
MADVIVVVKEVGDLVEITTRNNKTVRPSLNILTVISVQMLGLQTQKRDLVVVDSTEFSARLTLWGKQAEQFGTPIDTVIACRGVRVGDFNGKWLPEIANFPNSALH